MKKMRSVNRTNNLKKVGRGLLCGAISLAMLTGCGSSAAGDNTTEDDAAETSELAATESSVDTVEKEKIVIATSGSPSPYIYTDDNGELTGYDIDVINEIFNRLPQYETEIQIVEFASIFTGMDAGYYQVGVNHLGYNTERAEKYIYTDVYGIDPYGLVVRKDETEIETVYDLGGKTTEVNPSSVNFEAFEAYNERYPDNAMNLNYVDSSSNIIANIVDGIIDFELFTKATIESQIEASGYGDEELKIYDVPTEDLSYIFVDKILGNFFLVPKGYDQLAEDINEALASMVEDGTIHELRKQYVGVTDENDDFSLETVQTVREQLDSEIAN